MIVTIRTVIEHTVDAEAGAARAAGVERTSAGAGLSSPSAHVSLATLQRSVGNRAFAAIVKTGGRTPTGEPSVQRVPEVRNFDLNTQTNVPSHAELNVANLQAAITQKVANTNDRAAVLATLNQNLNAQAEDVPGLAAILAAGRSPATVRQVEDAIGSLLAGPHIAQWTQVEATQNDALLNAPQTTTSRTKGVPNQIPLATLDKITRGDFTGRIAQVKALDAATRGRLPFDVRDLQETFWLNHLSGDMDVRSCHTNGAQWLVNASMQARFAALDAQFDQWITANVSYQRRTNGNAPFRFQAISAATAADRRDYLWAAHCSDYNGSAYVEISIPGKKDLRLVYDCLNNRYYATVHYKWQRGYNPFFLITGA